MIEKEFDIENEKIVKNEVYESFKDLIECPICLRIMYNPMMCMNCQQSFCQKCIEEWQKKSHTCPNHCDESKIQKSRTIINILSKLKFECKKGCGEEILYNDLKNHYSQGCEKKKKTNNKFRKISKEQMKKLRKKGIFVPTFRSIKITFL